MLTLISLVNLHVELSMALEINPSRHVDVFRAAAMDEYTASREAQIEWDKALKKFTI